MSTILITGARGLLGWHTRCHFYGNGDEVLTGDRAEFESDVRLDALISRSDIVLHFAGMNRGDDKELYDTNIKLTEKLLSAIDRTSTSPHLIFSSSTHIERDTAYGRSKRACANLIETWVKEREQRKATILILPNVFGECGKPFYNSVVSTFCHVLAENEKPSIEVDNEIEIVHARRVAETIEKIINSFQSTENFSSVVINGEKITVSGLLELLKNFDKDYRQSGGIIPELDDSMILDLFNTYRSYLFPNHYPSMVQSHSDDRGSLVEIVKSKNGGQSFFSTTKPDVTRGDHYHRNKVERFMVVGGEGLIRVRKLFSDEVHEFSVNGKTPSYVDMPAFHTHSIENTGSTELVTNFWSNEIFDPDNPDTFREKVNQD